MLAKFRGVEYRCKARKIANSKKCMAYASDPGINVKVPRLAFDLDEISPRCLLEILIHEALHACLWDLDEAAVEETGRDIAKFLKQLGVSVDGTEVRTRLAANRKRHSGSQGSLPSSRRINAPSVRSTRSHTGKS